MKRQRLLPGGSFVYQSYDLAGDLTSLSNGSGLVLSYTYDSAARPKTVTSNWNDAQHPATLYTVDPSIGYFPSGAVRKAILPNGLTETAMYNKRLQPCRIEVNSTAASFAQCTDAVPSGNVLDFTYGYNLGSTDNGNVATWSSVGNQTFTRSYVYDSLNRISTMSDTAASQPCKGLSWTIDAWGNRTDQNVTSGTCGTFHSTVGTNNRLGSPYQYDAAGNMTYDGTHSYSYDAEDHLTQVDAGATASYIYDPNGTRVRKNSGGSWTEYFYDTSGSVTAEYTPAGWPVEYVYVGGQLVAQYRNSTTYSIFKDHLGSTHLITKLDKSVYDSLDFMPYGEQIAGDTGTSHKFTGKERDSESGLDNFGARFDSSNIGRFMSPDESKYATSGDPQSWNLYSYVGNNPLARIDPDGHNYFWVNGDYEWHDGADYNYTDKKGNVHHLHSPYNYLLTINNTGSRTIDGGYVVQITLKGPKDKIISQATGFSGGFDEEGIFHIPTPKGRYEINLNNRGGPETNVPLASGELGAWHNGIQEIARTVAPNSEMSYQYEWGSLRANLSRLDGRGTPFYLHGKLLDKSWTHGCICNRNESVLRKLFDLNPVGVGEGNKRGFVAVSVQ